MIENTLERLVDRIYLEGIGKAESKATSIIADAEQQALELRQQAKNDAAAFIHQAKEQAASIMQNVQGELTLAASRALSDLKREFSMVLAESTVKKPLREAFSDSEFVRSLVMQLANNAPDETISITANKMQIESFKAEIADALQNKLQNIEFTDSPKMKGFSIAVKGNGYEMQYDEASVLTFLEVHLKDATRKLFRLGND